MWRENAAWVKKAGGAVWLVARKRRLGQESRWRSVACGEKTLRGSRRPVAECGLGERICRVNQRTWRRSVVKKAGDAVWLVARKRRLGQRTWRRSVVCGEKTPRGSKDLAAECGLWRENAAWVKKVGDAVWSRRANLLPGSKDLAAECGLWRENAAWVKKAGGGVWSRRANLSPGSRKPVV